VDHLLAGNEKFAWSMKTLLAHSPMRNPIPNPQSHFPPMQHINHIRVRYSETDAMGTYYNSRVLEWFECGRTELCRATGKPYTQWETDGVSLPLIEAHVEYLGKAQYDDLLKIAVSAEMAGRVRMRFDVAIEQDATGQPVCRGYTVHAITDTTGKPIRPPKWLVELFDSNR
jgi:acyl-CoA thioester hydrolase